MMLSGKAILFRDKRPELEALLVALVGGGRSDMGWDLQMAFKKQTKKKIKLIFCR